MIKESYWTNGTCSRQIIYTVNEEDNTVSDVKFMSGCSGNLQGIAKLVDGKKIDDIIDILRGIKCRNNTSCPDQLALALMDYKERHTKNK